MRVDELSMAAHVEARADRFLRESTFPPGADVRPGIRVAMAAALVRVAVRVAPAGQLTLPTVAPEVPSSVRSHSTTAILDHRARA